MRPELRRKLISEGVVGLSVALGLHFIVVEPKQEELAEVRSRCAELAAALPDVSAQADELPRAERMIEESRAESTAIEQDGRLARNESAMFTRLMQLADEHRVRVDRLDPRPPLMPAAPGAPASAMAPGAAGAGADPSPTGTAPAARLVDAGIGYAVALEADFHDLCAFLAALQAELGYTLVRSLRVQPASGDAAPNGQWVVSATIETSHFSVDASPINIPPAPPGSGALSGVPTP